MASRASILQRRLQVCWDTFVGTVDGTSPLTDGQRLSLHDAALPVSQRDRHGEPIGAGPFAERHEASAWQDRRDVASIEGDSLCRAWVGLGSGAPSTDARGGHAPGYPSLSLIEPRGRRLTAPSALQAGAADRSVDAH